jgi:cell division septation protein DedD
MPAGSPAAGTPLPDTEALRQAALRASWARDRQVGQRRLWGRWVSWMLLRFGLPLLLIASLAGLGFVWMQPLTATNAELQDSPVATTLQRPASMTAAASAAAAAPTTSEPAASGAAMPAESAPPPAAAPVAEPGLPAHAIENPPEALRLPALRLDLDTGVARRTPRKTPTQRSGANRP